MVVLQTLFVERVGAANASNPSSGASIGITGYVTKVHVQIVQGTAPPPGRYYARVTVQPNGATPVLGSATACLWAGYVGGHDVISVPNQYVTAGKDYVFLSLTGGTNGSTSDVIRAVVEVSDTPVAGAFLAWQEPGTGPGEIISQSVAAPAAGAQQIYTIPALVRQRFRGYVGSVAVANSGAARPASFEITDGTNVVELFGAAYFGTLAINATDTFDWNEEGFSIPALGTPQICKMPTTQFPAAYVFATNIGNLVVGDQVNAARLLVEEWAMPQP